LRRRVPGRTPLESTSHAHSSLPQLSATGGDDTYTGNFIGSRYGFGGQAALLFPVGDVFSVGPNFNFLYNSIIGNYYGYDIFLPAVGPMFRFVVIDIPVYASINYNIGWANTDLLISCAQTDPTLVRCPSDDFTCGVRGYAADIRAVFNVTEKILVGPYLSLGSLVFTNFRYNFRDQSGQRTIFADMGIFYTQVGTSIYF
jgi:hypothetical protein